MTVYCREGVDILAFHQLTIPILKIANKQAQCKSGLMYTTSFEVVNLVLGLKMCMLIHKLGKKIVFGNTW